MSSGNEGRRWKTVAMDSTLGEGGRDGNGATAHWEHWGGEGT